MVKKETIVLKEIIIAEDRLWNIIVGKDPLGHSVEMMPLPIKGPGKIIITMESYNE